MRASEIFCIVWYSTVCMSGLLGVCFAAALILDITMMILVMMMIMLIAYGDNSWQLLWVYYESFYNLLISIVWYSMVWFSVADKLLLVSPRV